MQLVVCLVTAALIGVDQLTKWLAVVNLKGSESLMIIDGILSLTYAQNTGAAWSMLSDHQWILIAATSVMLIALMVVLLSGMFKNHKAALVGGVMVAAGGIGNLIDRIFRGFVVDFIKTEFMDFPIFNIADCLIVVGAIWLFVYFVFIYSEPDKIKKKKGETAENDDSTDDSGNSGNKA